MLLFAKLKKLGDSSIVQEDTSTKSVTRQNEIESLTHRCRDFLTLDEISGELNNIRQRIILNSKYGQTEKEELDKLLVELSGFELGRFLIANKGALSGGWTYYVIMGYRRREIESDLERFILHQAPSFLATRERFGIFQTLLQQKIQSNNVICSVPCGVMADLTTLELDAKITNLTFVGIDLDMAVLDVARELAEIQGTDKKVKYEFYRKNAWDLGFEDQFDIITSNGLNLYEKDSSKVVELYRQFFKSLKPGGIFIGSALSVPPSISPEKSEWKTEAIDTEALVKQKKIFGDVLQAAWQNFRTSQETTPQLAESGFNEVEFHWDKQGIFYSFVAKKPSLLPQDERGSQTQLTYEDVGASSSPKEPKKKTTELYPFSS